MAIYKRELSDHSGELVTKGKFNFGTFSKPFKVINPLDAKNPFNLPLVKPLKYLRLKEWEAFQIGNKDVFILLALYNTKSAGLAYFSIYDFKENKRYLYEKKLPMWKIKLPNSLYNSNANYISENFTLKIHNNLDNNQITIDLSIKDFKDLPNIDAHFQGMLNKQVEPMVICQPFGENRALYSHKCLMSAKGSLTFGNKAFDLSAINSYMIVDDHKGYYPYVMKYDWVTGIGYNSAKELVGFNLTDNQVLNHEKYNENCLWVNGKLHLLPPIKFTRPKGVAGEWIIKDEYGMVNISFTPIADCPVKINLLFIKADYHGPYGYFHGYIKDNNMNTINIDGYFGMGEKKYIRS